MAEKPNILLILTDQQNSGMMSCSGNENISTPAMDSIAAGGVRFGRAYCTNPLCVPSRFSLMTGLMPGFIGMMSNQVKEFRPIPEDIAGEGLGFSMRKAGYETAYAGKVHLPVGSVEDLGFDYICEDERDRMVRVCGDFMAKKRNSPFFLVASLINPHDICFMAIRDFPDSEQDRRMLERNTTALAALDEATKRPAGVDDKYFLEKCCPPLPPNFEPQEDEPEAITRMIERHPSACFRKCRRFWDDKRWRERRRAYARLTEIADRQVGGLLESLDARSGKNCSLVVFTSDHGDMDSSHRLGHKSMLYEEACRVPLIIRPPGGVNHGRADTEHLVSNGLDLYPTICEYGGAATPARLPGKSLRGIVDGSYRGRWREAVPVESAIGRAVITERFKYAVYDVGGREEQLTDLESDPHETRNALRDPGKRETLEELRLLFGKMFGPGCRKTDEVLNAALKA